MTYVYSLKVGYTDECRDRHIDRQTDGWIDR